MLLGIQTANFLCSTIDNSFAATIPKFMVAFVNQDTRNNPQFKAQRMETDRNHAIAKTSPIETVSLDAVDLCRMLNQPINSPKLPQNDKRLTPAI